MSASSSSSLEELDRMHRREFLGRCARCGAATALIAATASLVVLPGPADDGLCNLPGLCRECQAYAGCTQPRAVVARRTAEGPAAEESHGRRES